jgi:hypothetical protein
LLTNHIAAVRVFSGCDRHTHPTTLLSNHGPLRCPIIGQLGQPHPDPGGMGLRGVQRLDTGLAVVESLHSRPVLCQSHSCCSDGPRGGTGPLAL